MPAVIRHNTYGNAYLAFIQDPANGPGKLVLGEGLHHKSPYSELTGFLL